MQSVIGALRVNLGLDSGRFSTALSGVRADLQKWGQEAQALGKTLSARLTAPVVAAGTAMAAASIAMVGGLNELKNQAQVANAGVEEFQRFAAAARSVGIENDKFADILKDVNDRIGDFVATGGGPMADFFEQIGPKVGVTAEHFKNLSGPQALQLFYSSLEKANLSQADMTFYLEAMASDATALIPLLKNGGEEFERLGERAAKFGLASEKNIADAAAFQAAMSDIGAAIKGIGYALMDSGVLDAITRFAEKIAEWTAKLRTVDPDLVKFGVGVAAIAAAVGPLLVGLGLAATAIAAIGAPVALVVAGIALLTAGVVAFWPEIIAAKDAVVTFVTDGLTFLRDKILETETYLANLRDQFLQMGRDMIDGLLAGLRERWESVKAWFGSLAENIPNWIREPLGIQSPSRVFAEIGRNVMEGLRGGLESEQDSVRSGMQSFAGDIAGEFKGILKGATDFRGALGSILGRGGDRLIDAGVGGLFSALGIPGFAGGGFTGWGARSGGLDGRGGFLAMMHPRETVVDHTMRRPSLPEPSRAVSMTFAPTINAPGADAAGLARVQSQLEEMQRGLPAQVMAVLNDPRARR